MTTDGPLLRLLQLSSVSLPVGGFAFSQGMEYATESGWLASDEDVHVWLSLQICRSLATTDLPVMNHVHRATLLGDEQQVQDCNELLLACRESAELRLTDTAMGASLLRVLRNLDVPAVTVDSADCSFVVGFAWAAAYWKIDARAAMLGYGWSWLENQVAAATKLVPLGQTQAQQLLSDLQGDMYAAVDSAVLLDLEEVGASLPALAIASCQHESQYTRLFRS